MQCKICGNIENNRSYDAREQMYGTAEKFTYFQCALCGCLQISEIPSDMSRYYEGSYYSHSLSPSKNKARQILNRIRSSYMVLNEGLFGRLVCALFPKRDLASIGNIPLSRDSHVVDIGCGAGGLPYQIKEAGLNNVLGIDPFIEKDITYDNGTRIEKKTIFDLDQPQDLIMFHHSFEHMSAQLETLEKAKSLLKPGGTVLVRIPTVSSYAWRRYGVNWVQLDAPRHFFLHSVNSIKLLAENAGLEMYHHFYDSWSFQFWGSEQCEKGIPLCGGDSYAEDPGRSIFSRDEIAAYERRSSIANAVHDGDSASFYFRAR